jgi:transglutaminase-like putative cysteine protease
VVVVSQPTSPPASPPISQPWRLKVEHVTSFTYEGTVRSSYNEARMSPHTSARQTPLDVYYVIEPHNWTYTYVDYWGSTVTAFDLQSPHEQMSITAVSTVEVRDTVSAAEVPSWERLAGEDLRDRWVELLTPTSLTTVDSEVLEEVRAAVGERDPHSTAYAVGRWVGEQMDYIPGSTSVTTPAMDALRAGQGVCQDMVHVTLGLLRGLGIPARYVSGYMHPLPAAPLEVTFPGESHAWLEWWTGDWWGFDPTNGLEVGKRHVTVARGRDYNDVSPLKGIYSGPARSAVSVSVDVTRLA